MKGRVLGGRYLLEKPVGEGGMGVVYRARDNHTGQTVAVKIIRGAIACETRAVKRFLREAEAAGRLNHPAIVRILDEGTDVEHFLVMEFVEGVTIREWVKTFCPTRAWRPIVALLGEVLGALYHAHSRGIIHRDIKPDNIIVTTDRHAKLMDFGLARPMSSPGATITQTGAIVGTVAYMSPEQAGGKRGDERSDLYSLGVVAYELLTGRRPFAGESPMQTLLKHIQEAPLPPRRHNPSLPQGLEAIIMRLLAKRPEERFSDAAATWEAMHEVMQAAAVPTERVSNPGLAAPSMMPSLARSAGEAVAPITRPSAPRIRPAAMAAIEQLKASRPQTERPQARPPVELTVLYTHVQSLKQVLEERSPLEHMEHISYYTRTVEAVAQLTRGRILDRDGGLQVLVFDGSTVENPAAQALKAVERLKSEVNELAVRSSGGDATPPDLFLSVGIYTSVLVPPRDGSIDDSIREEMLNGARLLHSMSASERRYGVLCESTCRRAPDRGPAVPLKSIYMAGKRKPVQVFEMQAHTG